MACITSHFVSHLYLEKPQTMNTAGKVQRRTRKEINIMYVKINTCT